MNHLFRIAAIAAASVAATCLAEDRILRHEGVIHAPASEIWKNFQTGEGIQKMWSVPKADVDFRPGGAIRTTYDPQGTLGDDGTIINQIVTLEPERVLVLKSVAPKNSPDFIKAICETGWSVLRLEPLSPTATRITITGMGYKDGELYDKAYEFFEKGNAWSLEKMKEAFEPPDRQAKADAIRKRFESMVGDWEFSQSTSDGGIFRGKTRVEPLFDGRVYFAAGFLGNKEKLSRHSHFTAAVDPRSGEWSVWNFDQDGTFTLAPVHLEGNTMILDWNSYSLESGVMIPYQVKYIFLDDGTFDLHVQASPNPDGTRNTIAKVHYVRPADAGTPMPYKK
ncbi:MAG: SRPBCC domain-containing protein [Phycisphaeraceae bacterium]|nr:SRPBCC domain-containing protein [Phycisphaeraceae bacterium]